MVLDKNNKVVKDHTNGFNVIRVVIFIIKNFIVFSLQHTHTQITYLNGKKTEKMIVLYLYEFMLI